MRQERDSNVNKVLFIGKKLDKDDLLNSFKSVLPSAFFMV
jgi:hypothetical protein